MQEIEKKLINYIYLAIFKENTSFWGVTNSVGLATHLPLRAVQGEHTHLPRAQGPWEIFEFFPPAPNAGAGSEHSVISVAKEFLVHSFRHSLLLSELEW